MDIYFINSFTFRVILIAGAIDMVWLGYLLSWKQQNLQQLRNIYRYIQVFCLFLFKMGKNEEEKRKKKQKVLATETKMFRILLSNLVLVRFIVFGFCCDYSTCYELHIICHRAHSVLNLNRYSKWNVNQTGNMWDSEVK